MQRWSASVGERPCPAHCLERRTSKRATEAARHQAPKPRAHRGASPSKAQKETTSFSPARAVDRLEQGLKRSNNYCALSRDREFDRDISCGSRAMRRGGLRRTSPSCRSYAQAIVCGRSVTYNELVPRSTTH